MTEAAAAVAIEQHACRNAGDLQGWAAAAVGKRSVQQTMMASHASGRSRRPCGTMSSRGLGSWQDAGIRYPVLSGVAIVKTILVYWVGPNSGMHTLETPCMAVSLLQVADRVTVYTKSHEEDTQWVWTSTVGSHQYSIKEDDGPDKMVRGTRVVLHLKVRHTALQLTAMRLVAFGTFFDHGRAMSAHCVHTVQNSKLLVHIVLTCDCCVALVCCRRTPRSLLTPSAWPA